MTNAKFVNRLLLKFPRHLYHFFPEKKLTIIIMRHYENLRITPHCALFSTTTYVCVLCYARRNSLVVVGVV